MVTLYQRIYVSPKYFEIKYFKGKPCPHQFLKYSIPKYVENDLVCQTWPKKLSNVFVELSYMVEVTTRDGKKKLDFSLHYKWHFEFMPTHAPIFLFSCSWASCFSCKVNYQCKWHSCAPISYTFKRQIFYRIRCNLFYKQ